MLPGIHEWVTSFCHLKINSHCHCHITQFSLPASLSPKGRKTKLHCLLNLWRIGGSTQSSSNYMWVFLYHWNLKKTLFQLLVCVSCTPSFWNVSVLIVLSVTRENRNLCFLCTWVHGWEPHHPRQGPLTQSFIQVSGNKMITGKSSFNERIRALRLNTLEHCQWHLR